MPAMYLRRLILLLLVVSSIAGVSCKWLSRQGYSVDKLSPTGAYRVKVDVKVEEYYELMSGFHEWGKIEFFKGTEIVDSRTWDFNDNFEMTFIEGTPVVEWLGNNVLRMGGHQTGLPFLDEVVVSNDTDEILKYVSVACAKHEVLTVFDLAPKTTVNIRSSPVWGWTDVNGSLKYSIGYGGTSMSGKKFSGVVDDRQRTASADGSARFQIVVRPEDLK